MSVAQGTCAGLAVWMLACSAPMVKLLMPQCNPYPFHYQQKRRNVWRDVKLRRFAQPGLSLSYCVIAVQSNCVYLHRLETFRFYVLRTKNWIVCLLYCPSMVITFPVDAHHLFIIGELVELKQGTLALYTTYFYKGPDMMHRQQLFAYFSHHSLRSS